MPVIITRTRMEESRVLAISHEDDEISIMGGNYISRQQAQMINKRLDAYLRQPSMNYGNYLWKPSVNRLK